MNHASSLAPGWPGIPARWTSGKKSGIGTAVSRDSQYLVHAESRHPQRNLLPRVDNTCTRDLGFIVTDGASYFSEEKRETRSDTSQVAPGIPPYRLHNRPRWPEHARRDTDAGSAPFLDQVNHIWNVSAIAKPVPRRPRISDVVICCSLGRHHGFECNERKSAFSSRRRSGSIRRRDVMSGMARRTSFALFMPTTASIRPSFM